MEICGSCSDTHNTNPHIQIHFLLGLEHKQNGIRTLYRKYIQNDNLLDHPSPVYYWTSRHNCDVISADENHEI